MKIVLKTIDFNPDVTETPTVGAYFKGREVARVTLEENEEGQHKINFELFDYTLNHCAQARIILGASDLIDAQFSGEPEIFEINA